MLAFWAQSVPDGIPTPKRGNDKKNTNASVRPLRHRKPAYPYCHQKVHPVSHTIHNPYQDYGTLAKLCAKLEQQYGFEIDNHSTQRNHTAGRVRGMERHAGVESLITWVQQNALDNIKQATTWTELHNVLYENGLSIKPTRMR